LLKTLAKQDNTLVQARGGITVFNRTLANALLIGKKSDLEPDGKHDNKPQEKIV
jgi:hypothetical protein